MAGQLDSAFKKIAKQVVSQLGNSLDTSIVYTGECSEALHYSRLDR